MKKRNGNGWLLRARKRVRERTERLHDGMCQTTTQGGLQLRRSTETCWGRKRAERDRLKPKLPELTFQGSLLTPSGHTVPWPPAALQQVQTHTFVRIELWRNKRYPSVFFRFFSYASYGNLEREKKGRERRNKKDQGHVAQITSPEGRVVQVNSDSPPPTCQIPL